MSGPIPAPSQPSTIKTADGSIIVVSGTPTPGLVVIATGPNAARWGDYASGSPFFVGATLTTSSEVYGLAVNVIDGNIATFWEYNGPAGWLRFALKNPRTVSSYTITPYPPGVAGREPTSWTFEGSNDGATWTNLDTHVGYAGWSGGQVPKTFAFANITPYLFYRITITANSGLGGTYIAISEISFA